MVPSAGEAHGGRALAVRIAPEDTCGRENGGGGLGRCLETRSDGIGARVPASEPPGEAALRRRRRGCRVDPVGVDTAEPELTSTGPGRRGRQRPRTTTDGARTPTAAAAAGDRADPAKPSSTGLGVCHPLSSVAPMYETDVRAVQSFGKTCGMDVVRIGCLGAAKIAPAALVKPAQRTPTPRSGRSRPATAARAEAFAAKHGVPVVHGSYDELLADPEIDAVYNPLPNGLHAEWTLRALEAGKHVLCEKPFAANAAEAARVADAADGTGPGGDGGVPLAVPPAGRRGWSRSSTSGELGAVRRVEAAFCFPLLKRSDIRWQPRPGRRGPDGRRLLRRPHGADAGRRRTRRSSGPRPGCDSPGVDRTMQAELEFADGRQGRVRTSMLVGAAPSARRPPWWARRATMQVFNPLAPQAFHRLTVRGRRGRASRTGQGRGDVRLPAGGVHRRRPATARRR